MSGLVTTGMFIPFRCSSTGGPRKQSQYAYSDKHNIKLILTTGKVTFPQPFTFSIFDSIRQYGGGATCDKREASPPFRVCT
jgi:hypothetical protein